MAQLVIDATQPRPPVTTVIGQGSGGGIGRGLPARLTLELFGTPFNGAHGRTVIDFVLTNTGKEDLVIPIARDCNEVEAAGVFRDLAFHISADKRHENLLPAEPNSRSPFIILCGTEAIPSTVYRLSPGRSIRVRAEIEIPEDSLSDQTSERVFVGTAMMDDVVIKKKNGQPFFASSEVGNAYSPEYSPQMLLQPSK